MCSCLVEAKEKKKKTQAGDPKHNPRLASLVFILSWVTAKAFFFFLHLPFLSGLSQRCLCEQVDIVVFWHWETEVFCFSTFFSTVPCGSDITLRSPIPDFKYRIQDNILYQDPAMICLKDSHI